MLRTLLVGGITSLGLLVSALALFLPASAEVDPPAECAGMIFDATVQLSGGSYYEPNDGKHRLIIGTDIRDSAYVNGGGDCFVALGGNDSIYNFSGTTQTVYVAGAGADKTYTLGATTMTVTYGGGDNDRVYGNHHDVVDGGAGLDYADGAASCVNVENCES